MKNRWKAFLLALAVLLALCGCTAEEALGTPDDEGQPAVTNPEFERTPPPVKLAEFVGTDQALSSDGASAIDTTNVAQGYVAVRCNMPGVDTKFTIEKGEQKDHFELPNDGQDVFYPLTWGDGVYTFKVQVFSEVTDGGKKYTAEVLKEANVTLVDEYAPYTVPNIEVNYNANSKLVGVSHEITKSCATDLEVAQQIFAWVSNNIKYDTQKAEQVVSGGLTGWYVPNPDETLATKKGICYDYASLTAAMLRANGIPTVLVKGDVLSNGEFVYHAWNLVYIEEVGLITVGISVNQKDWTRIDATFTATAGQGIGAFVGDGSNYTEMEYS